MSPRLYAPLFFFNDTATTEIYTLSLHDALPISEQDHRRQVLQPAVLEAAEPVGGRVHVRHVRHERHAVGEPVTRSEEHTSELQSQSNLVCRLLLEKKKKKQNKKSRTIR